MEEDAACELRREKSETRLLQRVLTVLNSNVKANLVRLILCEGPESLCQGCIFVCRHHLVFQYSRFTARFRLTADEDEPVPLSLRLESHEPRGSNQEKRRPFAADHGALSDRTKGDSSPDNQPDSERSSACDTEDEKSNTNRARLTVRISWPGLNTPRMIL